jgi:hypothetical protein
LCVGVYKGCPTTGNLSALQAVKPSTMKATCW